MSRDYPDFWFGDWGGDREVLQDMGELAARLGSPVTYSRTGQVVNIWHGKYGFSGVLVFEGTTDVISLVATPAFMSGYSAKLTPSNSAPTNYAMLGMFAHPFSINKFGAEFGISNTDTIDRIEFVLSISDEGTYYYSAIKHTPSDDKWYYYNSSGSWVEFLTYALQDFDIAYINFIKLTVDFANLEYVRIDIGDEFYSLENLAIAQQATTSEDSMGCAIWVYNGVGQTGSVYLTHMILTDGEL